MVLRNRQLFIAQPLHQRGFRERVLLAYHTQCSFCRIKHAELLDAAHIIPDSEPKSLPVVPNGISLCKLHHAGFPVQGDWPFPGIMRSSNPLLFNQHHFDALGESGCPQQRKVNTGWQQAVRIIRTVPF
ncbi:MAG: hypothetical protein E4G94_01800 [ANME-2 cluster archaeon]|nr:MAG: hypothetical protein E4G94_01800 [ANME-2 cluster archaeon]